MAPPSLPIVRVAVAAVVRDGRLLVARRPVGKPLGGLWELPGGKVESGELPAQALTRELREETGLDITPVPPAFWSARHTYSHGVVEIEAWWCTSSAGEALALAADEVRWVSAEELAGLTFPPANEGLVPALVSGLGGGWEARGWGVA